MTPISAVTDDNDTLPLNSIDLINYLEIAVPARCLGPTEDVIAAHRYAGAREVIESLMAWRDETLEGIRTT